MGRLAVLILILSIPGCSEPAPTHQIVTLADGVITIPRSAVSDGLVHFYRFEGDDGNVDFLVRTDKTGNLHVHLDACYSCYRYGEGYFVEEGDVVCRACRYKYAIGDTEWDYIGACAPIPMQFDLSESSIVIKDRTLQRARRFF